MHTRMQTRKARSPMRMMISLETIHLILAFIMGLAIGYFSALVNQFFLEQENETV